MKSKNQIPPQRFRPACFAIIQLVLKDVIEDGRNADRAMQFHFRNSVELSMDDKAFVAHTCYSIFRYWYFLRKMAQGEDAVPPSYKRIIGIYGIWKAAFEVPRGYLSTNDLEKFTTLVENWANEEANHSSFDPMFTDLLAKSYGENQCIKILNSLNQSPAFYIRINTLKTDMNYIFNSMLHQNIQVEKISHNPEALVVKNRETVFQLDDFKKGFFEVQDISSQEVARFCDVKPGMRVIDACAGTGGKTLQLASLMNNKGRIISFEIKEDKLSELKKRARRAGVDIIETKWIESSKSYKRMEASADLVLIDAPCTGTGVYRRNSDAKVKFSLQNLHDLMSIQENIFTSYSKLMKPDGRLVFSTCSVLKEEGEDQVNTFLSKHSDWELVKEKRIFPYDLNGDGFYMAQLKRKN